MQGGISFNYMQLMYSIIRGLGKSYACCQRIAFLFVARSFSAPRTAIHPYGTVNYTYNWAVIVQKKSSRDILPP